MSQRNLRQIFAITKKQCSMLTSTESPKDATNLERLLLYKRLNCDHHGAWDDDGAAAQENTKLLEAADARRTKVLSGEAFTDEEKGFVDPYALREEYMSDGIAASAWVPLAQTFLPAAETFGKSLSVVAASAGTGIGLTREVSEVRPCTSMSRA